MEKPSDREEEFFKRQELERLKRSHEETAAQTMTDERERLKQLHWMRCPKCGLELSQVDFKTVEVDACFGCGGMFFDQGEIDRILDSGDAGLLRRVKTTLFG